MNPFSKPSAVDDRLEVMSLNLRFGLADDGPNCWSMRKKAFQPLFRNLQPDMIGFQEANDFQIDFIKGILRDYDLIGKRTPGPPFWQNNVIFFRKDWKCVRHEHFFLSPTPAVPSRSRKSRWPRQCTMGLFRKSGRECICINTHFDFESSVQVASANIIMERLSKLPRHSPVILTGDFNAAPFSPCYNAFVEENQAPGRNVRGFRNAFKKPFPGTFHGFTGHAKGDQIDWILYREPIYPEAAHILTDRNQGVYPSYHFPVYAVFG